MQNTLNTRTERNLFRTSCASSPPVRRYIITMAIAENPYPCQSHPCQSHPCRSPFQRKEYLTRKRWAGQIANADIEGAWSSELTPWKNLSMIILKTSLSWSSRQTYWRFQLIVKKAYFRVTEQKSPLEIGRPKSTWWTLMNLYHAWRHAFETISALSGEICQLLSYNNHNDTNQSWSARKASINNGWHAIGRLCFTRTIPNMFPCFLCWSLLPKRHPIDIFWGILSRGA